MRTNSEYMSKPFKAKVNNNYNFDFTAQQIEKLDSVFKSDGSFHVLDNETSFQAKIVAQNFNDKTYTVEINGNRYDVKLSDSLDILISELGLEASSVKKENDIKAPMPGLIVSVDVEVGQEVKEGEGILVLEAMKMENTLLAPRDGVVKSVLVEASAKVEKNAVLIEME
ncbi:Biotin/lipoyl attachment protein [Tenacibaculum xiamenense]